MPPQKDLILQITHPISTQRTHHILSPTSEILYTFHATPNFRTKPHLTIHRGASTTNTNPPIGTINLDFFPLITFKNPPAIIMRKTALKNSMSSEAFSYESSVLGGQTLRWRADGFFNLGDLVCEEVGGLGRVVARLKRKGLSLTSSERIVVMGWAVEEGEGVVEEVVAGAVALMELQRKEKGESRGSVEGGSAS